MKKLLTLLILVLYFHVTFAVVTSSVKGIVADKGSNEPLIGASVTLKSKAGYKESTSTGLDGSFIFKNVPQDNYEIEVKYISYQQTEIHFDLKAGESPSFKIHLEGKSNSLNEVNIKSRADAGSDQSARRIEQRSDQMLNAVSAKTIEVSPDITVANVMQRVSGVSVERSNNGEAQYPIIRGMEKRYISTLVNGIKIPSPDNKNRYVPLDIFPADIVDRLEIYKSLTPNMEGDAIAGAVNLVLKEAPDEFTVRANLGTGLSQSVINHGFTNFGNNDVSLRSPRIMNGVNYNATIGDFSNNGQHFTNSKAPFGTIAGLSIGDRTNNKKFGALVSGSYQNIYRNTNGVFFASDVDHITNAPVVTSIQSRTYSTQQERTSVIGKFDYKFNPQNKLVLDAAYINLGQNQYRYVSDTSLTLARTGIGQGRVTQTPRSIRNVQQIYNFSLHGDHQLVKNLSLNYTGVYSKATANEDRYNLSLITGDILSGGKVTQQPVTIDALKGQSQIFSHNSDQDKSGYLNFVYAPKVFNTKVEFSAGGMYRNKTRNATYDSYILGLPLTNSTQTYNGNIDNNTFGVSTLQGTSSDPLNYNFTENVSAGYAQFKFTAGKLQTLAGVRYEHTSQNWLDAIPVTGLGKTGSIKYYDFLPSLNFKYMLSDQQNLRLSYYSAISRPNFYELIPHSSGDPDADYQEVGNPNLKHTTADNYDLRYEFFPKAFDQFLAGVFYKRIVNPIEYSLLSPGGVDLVSQANNFGTAKNYGIELDATKYIHNFGFRANYSFTQSDITTSKRQYYKDASGNNTFRNVDQTRPLQGQAKNIGNLSFLYKNNKIGLDAQVSGVYTGERISDVSLNLNNDVWQKGFVTLDVSAEKKLFKALFIYAKATNLLNTPYQLFIKQPYPALGLPGATGQAVEYQQAGQNTFIRRDTYQQYYILGLRYKL